MPSYVNTPPTLRRYAIVKADTGEYLSQHIMTEPLSAAEFTSRGRPLTYNEADGAVSVWRQWLVLRGYLRRAITLPGKPVHYDVLRPIPRAYLVSVDMHPVNMRDLSAVDQPGAGK